MALAATLRETEPFARLPEQFIAELEQATGTQKYPPHYHIFNQHDQPTGSLYLIKTGQVEIVALTPGGVEMVVDKRGPGSFFGGTPIFSGEAYTAGARTVNQTECYLLPAALLVSLSKRFPQLAEYFTREILSRVRNLYADMVKDHAHRSLTQMEAYPFKKRLAEIMSTPVECCATDTPIRQVAQRLIARQIGALLVCNEANEVQGLISERDLVTKVLAVERPAGEQLTAGAVMNPTPPSMSPSTYMYEATSFMMSHDLRHLPILEQGKPVGMVTLQDLMRYRSQKAMLLIGNIREAGSIEQLTEAREKIVRVAKALMSEARSHLETMEILSYLHHCILRRGYEIVLQQFKQQGQEPPAIRFCFIIMGSGGRKEMLLGPDQDNGFIFENFPDAQKQAVESFFIPFAEQLVTAFEQIGYPRCKGKVMINNPLWRGRLKDWQERISSWINSPEPQRVRYSTIFFDFMPLVGDASLCQDLRSIVHANIRKFPLFLFHMMELDFKHKVPLGLLGRFSLDREHKGQLSTKQTGSIFIVDCVRMFMLQKHIDATTTSERIDKLVAENVFTPDTAENLKAAYEAFTFLRLRNEIALIEAGRKPSHYLNPYALSKDEQELLKEAFRVASKLQDSAKRHFNVG